MTIVAVNGLDQKIGVGDIDCGIRTLLDLGDFQEGLLHVVKDQFLVIAGLQPDGLRRLISNDPGVRDALFRHTIMMVTS